MPDRRELPCDLCGCTKYNIGFDDDSADIWWVCVGCGQRYGMDDLDNKVDKVKPQGE